MKRILQEIFIFGFSLYLTSLFFTGLKISEGILPLVLGGLLLAIGFIIVKPIMTIISLPFHFLSFGLFSIVTSAVVLFLVTLVHKGIQVVPFEFPQLTMGSIVLKSFTASGILSYCIISVTIYALSKILNWLFDLE